MSPSHRTVSLIFPGQGSQAVGMGVALAERYSVARDVFAAVDEALGQNLFALMENGPAEELTLTANTQPALMAVSVAAFRAMEEEGISLQTISSLAGHSLGEYSAYCVAGAISLEDTARLLRIRGEAMQAAVPVGEGSMAAILGLTLTQVEELLAGEDAQVANDNAPGQVVISGSVAAVEQACAKAKDAGAKKAVLLPVSAPFHSTLMGPAQERMAGALASASILSPSVPVFANVLAQPVTDPDEIRRTLTEQVTGRVRWTETISAMAAAGTDTFIEVGAGKVLSGLVKRIADGAKGIAYGAPDNIEAVRDRLAH